MRRNCDKNTDSAECRRLADRAAGLLAGIFALLALLAASLVSKETAVFMTSLAEPVFDFEIIHTEASPSPVPNEILISLADIDSDVPQDVVIQLMGVTAELLDRAGELNFAGDEPQVLIYHTHNTEAYTQTETYTYVESGDWRTEDTSCSVIAVGEELARILREDYGINVIHDTTQHEQPDIQTAYSRSLRTMEYYKQTYPSLELYIDLHRDAYTTNGVNTDYAMIDGQRVARMMFVVGTGRGSSGSADDDLPDFESNYALALRLTETMLGYNDRLMRNVRVKSGRYNQHISSKCLLVEVGHNANTLEEALAAMQYLARAIAEAAGISPSIGDISFAP